MLDHHRRPRERTFEDPRLGDVEANARVARLNVERGDRAREQPGGRDVFLRHRLSAGLELRDLQEPFDHAHEPPRLAVDDLAGSRDRISAGLALDDRLREALDRGEGCPQLVRDVGEERALAPSRALDLARHLVEGGAELGHLVRS